MNRSPLTLHCSLEISPIPPKKSSLSSQFYLLTFGCVRFKTVCVESFSSRDIKFIYPDVTIAVCGFKPIDYQRNSPVWILVLMEEMIMESFFIGIVILFLSGFITNFFNKDNKITVLSCLTAVASVLTLIPAVQVLASGKNLLQQFDFNSIFGTVNFVIDPLVAFFIVVISAMSLLSVIYSKGYLKPYIESGKNIGAHLVFLPALIASMLAVVTCQNALMFLVCWEIMSLSSFFLVIFENEKKDVLKAGVKYLVFMHVSVLFIIAAFALLSIKAESFDFSAFAAVLKDNVHLANVAFILAFIGFGTKA